MAGKGKAQTEREKLLEGLDELSLEELQARIARAQLLREAMLLTETEATVQKHDDSIAALKTRNEQRQTELAAIMAKAESIQKVCRHRQGGQHQNILRGDGKPAVSAMMMLDGYTIRLECSRCRKTVFTPNPSLEFEDAKEYARQMAEYKRFLELFEDSGMDMIRGPEFMFRNKGVPYVPKRV